MKKLLLGAAIGALIGSVVVATAISGRPPPANGGFRLIDSQWVLGIAQGGNNIFANNLTGAGTTQATATPLPGSVRLYELDTVSANTGFNLPYAFAGTVLHIYNATGTTATIYPSVMNNPNTNSQDTINAGTSITLATHVRLACMSAKDGVWGCT